MSDDERTAADQQKAIVDITSRVRGPMAVSGALGAASGVPMNPSALTAHFDRELRAHSLNAAIEVSGVRSGKGTTTKQVLDCAKEIEAYLRGSDASHP